MDITSIIKLHGKKNSRKADLTGADLRKMDFTGLHRRNVIFTFADLTDAVFHCAQILRSDFGGANLTNAKFYGADLTDANFVGANLTGADLSMAFLGGANFTGAILTDVNFEWASLHGANFRGAIMPRLPSVENIDAAIFAAIGEMGEKLNMTGWYCGTTHCRAGWAVALAGKEGYELERQVGPGTAGGLIYAASRPDQLVPNFFTTKKNTLADLRKCAGVTA